jgi:sterol desaturase/sphingolipid hydroxylase (fatty acid hydroxylase superfamily)
MDAITWFDPERASNLLKILAGVLALVLLVCSARAIRRRGLPHELSEFLANLSCGLGMYLISTVTFRWLHSLADERMTGRGPWHVDNPLLAIVICTVTVDFLSYVYHVVAHKTRFLWSLHVVHHSARHFNLSLGPRQSWLERMIVVPLCYVPLAMVLCWALNLDFWYLVIGHQIIFLSAFLSHTTAWERWPLGLSRIFINPIEHKMHHGIEEKYFDCNFGFCLRCWDVMFGTYRAPDVAMAEIAVGVAEHPVTDKALLIQAQTLTYLAPRPSVTAAATREPLTAGAE